MRFKTLAAIALSGMLAATIANAASDDLTDNMSTTQDPMQLADNGTSGNATMNSGLPSDGSGVGSNMSGTPSNNMSGTPSNNMSSGTSTASPSDEGGADTATGDDY